MCFLCCVEGGEKDIILLTEDIFLSRQMSIFPFFICIFVAPKKLSKLLLTHKKNEKVKDIIYDAYCSSTYVAAQ